MTPSPLIPTLGFVVATTGTGGLCQPATGVEVLWRIGTHDTPLPADLWLASGAEVPTGQELINPVRSLVADATGVLRSLAFLPVDPEAEQRVDDWLSKHEHRSTARTLTSRRKHEEPELA